MNTTFRMPEPDYSLLLTGDGTGLIGPKFHLFENSPKVYQRVSVYKSGSLRDVLEQAARICDEKHWPWHMGDNSGPKECAEAIRAMIKEIPE